MDILLKKELKEVKASKKRYRSLFLIATITLLIVLLFLYKYTVLDYAVLENVKIKKNLSGGITFKFDIVEAGKLDFHYGKAMLVDSFDLETGRKFNWNWTAKGETKISIRSRKFIVLPHWDSEKFKF